MQTDISLKRLTALCGADLLPLFGVPFDRLLRVETLEQPASARRLDNVLHVRSPDGQTYLHVVEWQGYPDLVVLWRLMGYLAWLGQKFPTLTVVGTVVYLSPACDRGATLSQVIDGQEVQRWSFSCVRLWEHEAAQALATGRVGLAVLSLLMRHATEATVEQAVDVVLRQTTPPHQNDLLSILATFAEPLMERQRLLHLIGKERLMESEIISSLVREMAAEEVKKRMAAERDKDQVKQQLEQVEQQMAAERARLEAMVQVNLREQQQTLEDALIARFPQAPITLLHSLRQVTHPAHIHQLVVALFKVADVVEFEHLLQQTIATGKN
ncbi:MAG: hypothetical protein HC884_08000 [Chloroflexaceae bacterium]|nr:hypothetical protein [Chloroflexaceae bacterium]